MKKNVNLRITSTQYSENLKPSGEAFLRELEKEESLEILTEGTMYLKNNARYISYEESEEGGLEDSHTLVKLEDGSIRIRRYGRDDDDDGMDKEELDEEGYGKISVDYKIKFDRFFSRRNILEIEVMPS